MNTRRLLTLVSISLLAAGGVSACSANDDPEAPEDSTEESAEDSAEDNQGGEDDLSGPLAVFAAASLQGAFDDLLEAFGEAHPGVEISPAVYDGSSTLVTQLEEGAEVDVLATANEPTMEDAVAADLLTGDPVVFATNELVIAVPEENPHGVTDLPDVLELDYAICAVQVPCGNATAQLFEAAELSPDPVSEEQNVTAVANRVSEGEVDAGFIYTTDVAARPELTGISADAAQIINTYPIGTTSDSEVGAAFVEFVGSEQGLAVLEAYGFGQP